MSFADDLHQMIWGRLVALRRHDSDPVLRADCVDNSGWAFDADDGDPTATEAWTRVARLWPTGD